MLAVRRCRRSRQVSRGRRGEGKTGCRASPHFQIVRSHGSTQVEALAYVAAKRREQFPGLEGFHTLRHDFEVQGVRKSDDRAHDHAVFAGSGALAA